MTTTMDCMLNSSKTAYKNWDNWVQSQLGLLD